MGVVPGNALQAYTHVTGIVTFSKYMLKNLLFLCDIRFFVWILTRYASVYKFWKILSYSPDATLELKQLHCISFSEWSVFCQKFETTTFYLYKFSLSSDSCIWLYLNYWFVCFVLKLVITTYFFILRIFTLMWLMFHFIWIATCVLCTFCECPHS